MKLQSDFTPSILQYFLDFTEALCLMPSPSIDQNSKKILDRPNCFGQVQIVLVRFILDFS